MSIVHGHGDSSSTIRFPIDRDDHQSTVDELDATKFIQHNQIIGMAGSMA